MFDWIDGRLLLVAVLAAGHLILDRVYPPGPDPER